ncbi:hypothetical protein GGF50DRAFT_120636 [Schizophyllum commune]
MFSCIALFIFSFYKIRSLFFSFNLNTLGDVSFGLTRGTSSCALRRGRLSTYEHAARILDEGLGARQYDRLRRPSTYSDFKRSLPISRTTSRQPRGQLPRPWTAIPSDIDIEFPATSTMASRYFDDGRVSSAFEAGEVAVVVIPRMECNVAVTRACSPGALSHKLTTGHYRTLASRSSHRALPCEQSLPLCTPLYGARFQHCSGFEEPSRYTLLCPPLYETPMHSTTPLCTPLCKTSRLSTSPNSRKASSTFTLGAVASGALKAVASDALKVLASGALDTTDLIPTIVVDSRAEATYLRPPRGVLRS